MDQQIVKKIFESCASVVKDLEKKKIEKAVDSFPVLDQASISALANSLSKLLSHKVSPDAYQRYSARIQIIELMRDWIQPPEGLSPHPTFHQSENMSEFILILMKKYLNRDILQNKNNTPQNLVKLGKLLFNLSKQNAVYTPHLKIFLEKVEGSELTCSEADDFVDDVLTSRDQLDLQPSLTDKLHIIKAKQFIETPLIDNFILNLDRLKTKTELSTSDNFERMIILISSSSRLFQLASNILKQLFIHCDFSLLVIDYIQFVLRNVLSRRDSKNMSLDLYPTHMQSHVSLLRIDSNYHTESSKKYILKSLGDMYLKNTEQVFILMLHYPNWLEELSNYVRAFI
ncbi:uncharacterized protein LOC135170670 [Diachasmimorpha longicaudata]|uniref:uncharacterized protein LOC135170670 n=1 Tax=Diachasmimorpha longicaudata TaxID=58733 RepID=UPI0030B8728F